MVGMEEKVMDRDACPAFKYVVYFALRGPYGIQEKLMDKDAFSTFNL